jgi:guanidinopropionase
MSSHDLSSDERSFLENLYWWGVPTLFGCPHDEDAGQCDIALVGVPHSSGNGATERDQHLGPRAIRNISGQFRRTHGTFRFSPWEECRIHDLGDVLLPQAMVNDVSVRDIEAYYKTLDDAGVRPVSVGGDHSITGPIVKAIAGASARLSGGQKAALLQFDAHTDTYDHLPHWLGSVRSAAHWASYIATEGHIDTSKSVQLGIRGHTYTLDWKRSSERLGYRVITFDEFQELGIAKTVEIVRERVGDAPLYITFDLDVLDPTVAPAVAAIVPDTGFLMHEAIRTLQGMRGLNVIGADVVCMVPTKDNPNQITALNATAIMFEQLCLIVDYVKAHREG